MTSVINTPLMPESFFVHSPTFPPLPDWLEPGDVLERVDPVFIFPIGKPVGNDPTAYLRDVVLPHLAGLPERPSPELVYEAAVLELVMTYPQPQQPDLYERRRGHAADGSLVDRGAPMRLRIHALATHGYAAEGRKRPYPEWLEAARAALTTYKAARSTPSRAASSVYG